MVALYFIKLKTVATRCINENSKFIVAKYENITYTVNVG